MTKKELQWQLLFLCSLFGEWLRGLILLYTIKSVPAEGILIGFLGSSWDIEYTVFGDEVEHRVVDDKQAIGRNARHHPLQSLAILERSVADVPYSAAYGERLESLTTVHGIVTEVGHPIGNHHLLEGTVRQRTQPYRGEALG